MVRGVLQARIKSRTQSTSRDSMGNVRGSTMVPTDHLCKAEPPGEQPHIPTTAAAKFRSVAEPACSLPNLLHVFLGTQLDHISQPPLQIDEVT